MLLKIMNRNFNKYFILIFAIALVCCEDKSIEPLNDPDTEISNNYIIAFTHSGDVYTYHPSTKTLINITSNIVDTFHYATTASFSDDGHELLYTLDYSKAINGELMLCERDDIFSYNVMTGQTKRITNNEFREINPKYSKDGGEIIYQSFENGNSDIYKIKNDGSQKTLIVPNSGYEWYPTFIMDSKILYSSIRNGNTDYYLNNKNGQSEERITFDNWRKSEPSIASDNTFFIYTAVESIVNVGDTYKGIFRYDFTTKTTTRLVSANDHVKMHLNPILSNNLRNIVCHFSDGSWTYIYLMGSDGNNVKNLGKGSDAKFTKDSRYVVFQGNDGLHMYDINLQRDSLVLNSPIWGYNLEVSTIK